VPSSIIRGLAVITEPADRRNWRQSDDGTVLQRDGVIAEIGPFAELSARHRDASVIGTGRQVVLPGFVNGHHHIGLTPVQHGSPDMPTRAHRRCGPRHRGGRSGLPRRTVHPSRPRRSTVRVASIIARPLAEDEVERRRLSKALLPHVRRFYDRYFDPKTHLPYYRPSSRQ
jgi:hypothetical protein